MRRAGEQVAGAWVGRPLRIERLFGARVGTPNGGPEVETSRIDEELNQWLRNAHAMEEQAEKMLEAQSSRIENYPELAAGINRHLSETRRQKDRLEQCLARRGTSSSSMKDVAAKFTAVMQGVGGSMASDEVVKGAMASYTFEHFEISAYRTLIAAAELAGDGETARVCTEICTGGRGDGQPTRGAAAASRHHLPAAVRPGDGRSQALSDAAFEP